MKTVKEVSRLTGVSIRTLHHYDAIGLLKPTRVTQAGYRLYDHKALERLQRILLLRELDFSLKDIGSILDTPGYDPDRALQQQIELLELRRSRLDQIIAHARQIQKTGVISMDFSPFDTTDLDRHAAEAKAKWGRTEAYREFEEKTAGRSDEALRRDGEDLMAIFARLGACRQLSPECPQVQELIGQLRDFITGHYYTCTPQILMGLAQMYIAGDSMTENIDRAGGPGTARFVHDAIVFFCR